MEQLDRLWRFQNLPQWNYFDFFPANNRNFFVPRCICVTVSAALWWETKEGPVSLPSTFANDLFSRSDNLIPFSIVLVAIRLTSPLAFYVHYTAIAHQ
jgi:hypothetical protein